MSENQTLGFIGLGVMGVPMCRNLAEKSNEPVVAYDIRQEPIVALAEHGVDNGESIAGVAATADIIFLSLPGEPQVRAVCLEPGGVLEHCREGQTVVDTSSVPPGLSRELAEAFARHGVDFADAPVARTRQAAHDGTLAITVGGSDHVVARIRPYLECMGTEITHCGEVGAGEVLKLMNNMIVMEIVNAIGEALAIGRRAGVDGQLLFETLAKGSADSFVLRSHGLKHMVPGDFPEQAFPVTYALKDLTYALALADELGVDAAGAKHVKELLEQAIEAGYSEQYYPVIQKIIDPDSAAA
ncbi:MAG: NAD(P)-dependent oxidoreductase [Alphaproteobacteria bacterium]|jgi:hypothetical protein|nr:NAD(P)-dependent oxidoreductase [Alphaproteobacteria bacterium]